MFLNHLFQEQNLDLHKVVGKKQILPNDGLLAIHHGRKKSPPTSKRKENIIANTSTSLITDHSFSSPDTKSFIPRTKAILYQHIKKT